MESNYASAYKLKSGTVDKRLMRVERRSIDWKSQRQDLLQKRRNMSPLAESFQNSSTMSNNKSTMHTPSGKRSEDTENTLKGKTSLKAKTKESDELKARLSKWKQEKEAKKKLKVLEKAKNPTFKTGKLDHKDKDRLFNIGPVFNNKKSKPVVPHQKSFKEHKPIVEETQPKPTTSTRNLKRKGDDLHSSSTKKQVLGPKNIRDTSTARSLKPRFPERELKKPKTPPSKRITRRTKVVESRLFAATASTAAKQSTAPKAAKPAPEKKVTRAAADKKKAVAKTDKTLASTCSSMPASDNDTPREITMEKVNVSRGNAYFPEEFSFTAPANLKSYTFNPMSPDSAANFLFSAKDTGTMSFTINSPEGRCSTPTPRENKKKNNVDDNSVFENLSVKVTQDVQENTDAEVEYKAEATTSYSVINTSADDSGNKTTLENTILERTVIVGNDDNDITVTVTPKKVTSSDEEKQVTKTRAGIRKSSRLVSLNDSVSSDSQAEVKPSSPAPGRRRSLRNKSVVTSESSDCEIDSKKRTPRSRRSLRRSVHSKNQDEDHGLPVISESSSPKKNPETISEHSSLRKSTETMEDEELDSILSDSMISKSINKYDDSVFVDSYLKPESKIEKVLPESSSEENDKASFSASKIESSISTPKTAKPENTKRLSKSAERTITVQDDGFRTPGAPMSAQRRTRRKTVGSSNPSQARSPEEWVKILAKSPMIEMNRRTPKSKKSPVAVENKIEQPNFDDIEEILNNSLQVEPDSTTTSETEMITSDHTDIHNDDDTKDDVKTSESTKSDINSVEAANDVSSDIASTITKAGENKIGVSNTRSGEIKANEIVSTVEEPMEVDVQSSDDVEENGEHDVKYFRTLTKSESNKLSTFNIEWNTYLQENKNLTEEVEGCIRTVVGQSQLLMDQRFKQFTGLIDNCEFKTGEKETKCEDLQGFWDMIYYQVEDVQKKFIELGQRKDKNWVVEEKKVVKQVLKKKTAKTIKPAVKSKFASFRAEMMKQKDVEASNKKLSPQMAAVKTFDAGFFKVNSPVKKSPHFHCEGGTPRKSKLQTEDKESVKLDQKDDTEQMDTEETYSVKVAQVTEETAPESDQSNAENSDENADDTNDSKNTKRRPLSVLTPSGHNVRTPRRKSYAPNVPSPLLQDITPKPKTRRSLAANMAAQALDGIDMCPLTSSDTFMTTPKSTGRSKRGTPKTTDDTTPRRRSLRVRKSVCFTETPTKKTATEPTVETDDLSLFLQPTIHVHSPVNDNTLILDEDSPFSLKYLEEELSSKKSTRASSRRKSTKRSPSDEKRRRSTRRSVHFDKSPACTQVKSRKNTDELLFTPPQKQTFSTPTSKSRPSLLFTPPGKENTSIDADNLISFTP